MQGRAVLFWKPFCRVLGPGQESPTPSRDANLHGLDRAAAQACLFSG